MLISGQITVTTAGTAVQGTDVQGEKFLLKALPTNTGVIYVGNNNSNDVDNLTGFPLSPGDTMYLEVSNLQHVWFDASVNSQKVAWILVEV